MTIVWSDWILLLVRWLHIVTAIAWIGTSFYFIWLDKSLRQRQGLAPGIIGDSWSVHGGGFYQVQKYAVAPPTYRRSCVGSSTRLTLPGCLVSHSSRSCTTGGPRVS